LGSGFGSFEEPVNFSGDVCTEFRDADCVNWRNIAISLIDRVVSVMAC
jgi:hypothetical protein